MKNKTDKKVQAYISGKLSEGYTPRQIILMVWNKFGYFGGVTGGKVYVKLSSGEQMEIK